MIVQAVLTAFSAQSSKLRQSLKLHTYSAAQSIIFFFSNNGISFQYTKNTTAFYISESIAC